MGRKCPECGSDYVVSVPGQDAYVCQVCSCGWTGIEEARRQFINRTSTTPDYTNVDALYRTSVDALYRTSKLMEAFNGTHWRNYQVLRDSRSSNRTRLPTERTSTGTEASRTTSYPPTQRTSSGVGWDIKAGVEEFWPDGLPLEGSLRQEPIRAWKNAEIVLEQEATANWTWQPIPMFTGVGVSVRYGPVETMVCAGGRNHKKPELNCGCGFWAYKTTNAESMVYAYSPILEVDLYGKVLEGENGYRAEKQRVLAVHVVTTVCPQDTATNAFNLAQYYGLEYHEHASINDIAFKGTYPTDGTVE